MEMDDENADVGKVAPEARGGDGAVACACGDDVAGAGVAETLELAQDSVGDVAPASVDEVAAVAADEAESAEPAEPAVAAEPVESVEEAYLRGRNDALREAMQTPGVYGSSLRPHNREAENGDDGLASGFLTCLRRSAWD